MTAAPPPEGGKKKALKPKAPPPAPPADRVVVRLAGDLDAAIGEAMAGLGRDPELYHRGGELVRVVRDGLNARILPHGIASLRARLAKYTWWLKWEHGDEQPITPPDVVVAAIRESPERWERLRRLDGLVEHPVLLPSGEVLQVPGFELSSNLLFTPSMAFPSIPARPGADEAAAALRWLWVETSFDFPYRGMGYAKHDPRDPDGIHRFLGAREHPDAWGLVAAILTLAARPAIDGDLPAILFDATTPGSGKGLQADVVSTAMLGHIKGKLTYPSIGGLDCDHVLEQMLSGEARQGSSLVVLDEVKHGFGGSAINKVLTSGGRAAFRPLGVTETLDLPWFALLLATGNNIAVEDNTRRRVLVSRLEPPIEDPTKYKGARRHAKLPHWVRTNRARIIAAALTVLRGYVVAGRPEEDVESWGGGFEAWSELIARAIRWAGGGNVLGCRPTSDPEARNEEAVRMELVLDALERLCPKDAHGAAQGLTVGQILDRLYTPDVVRGRNADGSPLIPDGFDEAREAIATETHTKGGRKPEAAALGRFFRTWKRRPVGERRLEPGGLAHGAQKWRVAKLGA